MTQAKDCSKPRLDEFGGGAAVVHRRNLVSYIDPLAVAEQICQEKHF